MSTNLFDLSTAVVPADTFTVDGEQYELLGLAHLTPEDEVTVSAMFARYTQFSDSLASAGTEAKALQFAKQMRDMRLRLLTKMSTCPADVVKKITLKGQITLMDAIGEQLEGDESPDVEAEGDAS